MSTVQKKLSPSGNVQSTVASSYDGMGRLISSSDTTVSGLAAGPSSSKAVVVARPEDLRNHRLIVMFFDLTSMQPEDLDRSVDAAKDFKKVYHQNSFCHADTRTKSGWLPSLRR